MNSSEQHINDVIIIGGGPAGLSAALVLGRCRRIVTVVDAGEPRNAAARGIHGLLGHDGLAPQLLLEKGRAEIARYGVKYMKDIVVAVHHVDRRPDKLATCFRVETKHGKSLQCRKLLFATGMRDELPDWPGLRECYGTSVHHCPYCDGWEHRDQRIAVYAKQSDQAAGLAIALRGWSQHITVLTGGDALSSEEANRLSRAGIAWREEPIIRLRHDQGQLQGVELRGDAIVPVDALFFESVQHRGCDLPRMLGVSCDDEFSGRTNRKQKTDVRGVFLAGDADGNVEFVVVAAAEGATAAVAINRELLEEDAPPK